VLAHLIWCSAPAHCLAGAALRAQLAAERRPLAVAEYTGSVLLRAEDGSVCECDTPWILFWQYANRRFWIVQGQFKAHQSPAGALAALVDAGGGTAAAEPVFEAAMFCGARGGRISLP
jgi:hypothetical protein